ncbi:Brother of CDO [Varanus komodoensis]|nr:Brother of CDO [Varanus komodoensis]
MQKAGLDEAQVGNKISGRNINNLRDDTTLMAESEEELKSLLIRGESLQVTVQPASVVQKHGGLVTLRCVVEPLRVNVTWRLNGRELFHSDDVLGIHIDQRLLTIAALNNHTVGQYQCMARVPEGVVASVPTMVTLARNGNPFQYLCHENPMDSTKRQKDMMPEDEPLRSEVVQYATGEEQRASTSSIRKNEVTGSKPKGHSVADVSGGERRV